MTPVEGAPAGLAIHASAVAINGRALLIVGRSGAGKSRLAAALVAASTRRRRIVLVGDDRVLLVRDDRKFEVRPHPRTAGFLERRGLGLVAMSWCDRANAGGVAVLGGGAAPDVIAGNLPSITLVESHTPYQVRVVLAWWPFSDS